MGRGGDPTPEAPRRGGLLVGRRRRRPLNAPEAFAEAPAPAPEPDPPAAPAANFDIDALANLLRTDDPVLSKLPRNINRSGGKWMLLLGPELRAASSSGGKFWQGRITADVDASGAVTYFGVANWGKVGAEGQYKALTEGSSLASVCRELSERMDKKRSGSYAPVGAPYVGFSASRVLNDVQAKLGL